METIDHSPVVAALRQVLGGEAVVCDRGEMLAYECDGLPIANGLPTAVVFPIDTRQVAACVRVLAQTGLEIVSRGSGTGLTGGCVAFDGGVVISTSRMTRIESIDLKNRVAVVQAGVRNLALSQAVAALGTPLRSMGTDRQRPDAMIGLGTKAAGAVGNVQEDAASRCRSNGWSQDMGLRFSPDPSSQSVATIGGNAATNAGGINTLKYGVTCSHILGMEVVLPDGSVITTRAGGLQDGIGADLPALLCGSEGTLGLITRLWCRLTPMPRNFRTVYALFESTEQACQSVSDVIAAGIVPTSMEMLDGAMMRVVEAAFHYGFDAAAEALLLIEIDGVAQALDQQLAQIVQICTGNQAREIQQCADASRRAELWSARKRAFGAIGRISRSYCTQDACVPRSKLAEAIGRISRIGQQHGITIHNVFHAGDGNVHPILLFDQDDPEDVQRVLAVSQQILEYCVGIGGTITGEHGIGVEKLHLMARMFNPATLDTFDQIKRTFDPHRRMNDGKLILSDRIRIELKRPLAPNVPGGAL